MVDKMRRTPHDSEAPGGAYAGASLPALTPRPERRGLRPGDELTLVEADEGLPIYQHGADTLTARLDPVDEFATIVHAGTPVGQLASSTEGQVR